MTAPYRLSRRNFLDAVCMAGAAGIVAGPRAAAFAADTPARRDGEWVIGCYTRPWAAYDYRVALDAIAEAGFKHAGLMTTKAKPPLVISVATTPDEAARVAEEVKKRGLKVPSVYGGGFPVNKSVAEGATALRRLIDSCAAVQAKTVLMGGIGDPKFYQTYYRAIAECCDYAAEKGMAITIKPHGGMNATGPQCRKAIELVGNKNFQLWYDPGNIYYYSDGKLDPVVDAATVDGLVTGMCVKDYEPPKNVMLTPGTGQVDFPAVMARLKKGGFSRGPMVVETLKPGSLPETLEQAKKARQFVEELTRKVDAMP